MLQHVGTKFFSDVLAVNASADLRKRVPVRPVQSMAPGLAALHPPELIGHTGKVDRVAGVEILV